MDKVKIFVDFWNLQLSINENTLPGYRLDWKKLSPYLIHEAKNILATPLRFDGTNVYISYNSHTPKGVNLHRWSSNTLDRFPGISVISKERKPKYPPKCPHCYKTIELCPHCGDKLLGTIEKGIDTAIVTDMIKLAWEEAWDVALLVSSDRDFIPLVDFLTNKGRRVINVYFPPKGIHLAKKCWASIDLRSHLHKLSR
ncbi:MAG: NYN domain-containing protein [Anaerolineae bacterium]|nr:NYN domain-containing protein [Anaerolineae bacterium]